MEAETIEETNSEEQSCNNSSSNKESEDKNVDAIQKCIENSDKDIKEIQDKKNEEETEIKAIHENDSAEISEESKRTESTENLEKQSEKLNVIEQENAEFRTSVMDIILDSDSKADTKKPIPKQSVSPKGNIN